MPATHATRLTMIAAKRARQISNYYNSLGEGFAMAREWVRSSPRLW